MNIIFIIHVVITLLITGMMWFIQLIHYPLLKLVGGDSFQTYESAHTRLAIFIVVSLMVFEAITGVLLLIWHPQAVSIPQIWLGLGLLAVIWLSTMFLQVPQHHILAKGFDAKAHHFLVQSNWIRTLAYSLRTALLLWIIISNF